ncbi:hypothetical protein Cst_c27100 [Thermoclostridium stercorarium subsp. stercorarium DSM 8532]|uniref:Uncharacterized protein n=1 Tax=Thermoclostridium stercorarium (strain ATCC 35414 / DSM 8532 / NCIMB 11754) TaxID=1121335 RepID=L7VSD7_THES1|nr:hypothetical protein Cst_c27100 [Thermoclostridium stercorarium subsp. stercorarium DSM 8532]
MPFYTRGTKFKFRDKKYATYIKRKKIERRVKCIFVLFLSKTVPSKVLVQIIQLY